LTKYIPRLTQCRQYNMDHITYYFDFITKRFSSDDIFRSGSRLDHLGQSHKSHQVPPAYSEFWSPSPVPAANPHNPRPTGGIINLHECYESPSHGTKLYSKHFTTRHRHVLLIQHTMQKEAINSADLKKITIIFLQSHRHFPERTQPARSSQGGAQGEGSQNSRTVKLATHSYCRLYFYNVFCINFCWFCVDYLFEYVKILIFVFSIFVIFKCFTGMFVFYFLFIVIMI
jgi:hypothetical protein